MNGGTERPQDTPALPHKLCLDERSRLTVSAVTEVVSFDETSVILKTVKGLLLVRGEGLRLKTLSTDGGQVAVTGQVNSIEYQALRREGGFWKRLLG